MAHLSLSKEYAGKMPNAVSKYIVDFFVNNSSVLLNDTNVRTPMQNAKQTAAYKALITQIREEFGYDVSERKIRNHFDHVRSKVISKGMSLKKGIRAEKKYRARTGGGVVVAEERIAIANDTCPFDTPAEEKLWNYFDNTPLTTPFLEGESSVGKTKSPAEENRVQEDVQPIMDDFEFDSDVDEEEYASEEGRLTRSIGGERGKALKNRQRVTDADLLSEQFRLCQDQQKFMNEMIHTLHVFCDFIASQKNQHTSGVAQGWQGDGGRAAIITGDENVEESVISSQ